MKFITMHKITWNFFCIRIKNKLLKNVFLIPKENVTFNPKKYKPKLNIE